MSVSTPSPVISHLVTTIIPVYNRPDMLRTAVESVIRQTYRPIEVIIADDGSTDETGHVGQSLADSDPLNIKYVRIENQGPGPAREAGRLLARGEFLQYLDSDDRLLPNKFADQVDALHQHPECDIAYGLTRLVDANGSILAEPFKWTDRQISELFPGLLVDRWWCTHTPLYRRSVADKVGAWTDMRWSQDWEYDARFGARNCRLINCGSYVSEHVQHSGVRQTSEAKWSEDPERLRNRVDLLTALLRNARSANVPRDAAEYQHFARWCFTIARQCSTQGMRSESEQCTRMARDAAQDGKAASGIRLYQALTKVCGHRMSGRLTVYFTARRRATGDYTMDQSFARADS